MPRVIVTVDVGPGAPAEGVVYAERILPTDLESRHFAEHLLERLAWAVGDARDAELSRHRGSEPSPLRDGRTAGALALAGRPAA